MNPADIFSQLPFPMVTVTVRRLHLPDRPVTAQTIRQMLGMGTPSRPAFNEQP